MRKIALLLAYLIILMPSNAVAGIDQDLEANWSFDSNFQDASGSNHLNPGGGVTLIPGRFGMAAAFDGTNLSYLATTAPTTLAMGEDSFSVSLWIRPESGFSNGRLLDHRGTGPGGQHAGWQFRIRQNNGFWYFRGSAVDDGVGSFKNCNGCGQTYAIGEWQHVVMVYKADDLMEFYVNGQLDGTKTVGTFSSLSNSLPLVLGGAIVKKGQVTTKATQRFKGAMDEVRIYRRALSAADVFELYGQPSQPPTPSFTDVFVDYLGEFAGASHSLGFLYLDSDTSGNGIPDFQLIGEDDDLDGDGIANRVDDDDDGDGIADIDDKAGYDVATGSAAGYAPTSGLVPASFFNNGENAAAAGNHPGDFWQFVPNGIHEQSGTPYTDSQSRAFPKVFLNPAAYLYIDQYDRTGALVSDGIPDALQAAMGSNGLPAYILEKDYQTTSVDRTTNLPGLLGTWSAGQTGQTIFYLADDDVNTTPSAQFSADFPYLPLIGDQYDQLDGLPDYDLYGTTDEADPAIPASLLQDDSQGIRLWRYRKLVGDVSNERDVVYFLTVYFNSGGRTNNTYYSRAAFNESFGFFGRNADTTGDDFGLDDGAIGLGASTPDNWFPNFQNLSEHNLVAQYAFGMDWQDVASAPNDGSVPVAIDPADQDWVNHYENYSSANRIVNYVDMATNLTGVPSNILSILSGRYGSDLTLQDNRLILRRKEAGNAHLATLPIGPPTPTGYVLSWEDLFAGGNRNFVDVVFFTNRPPNP